jgi:hypothetical protein
VKEKILVTNGDTYLGDRIVQGLQQRDQEVYKTMAQKPPKDQEETSFTWDGSNLLSTKNLFHSLENHLGSLDRLIIPVHPAPLGMPLLECSIADLAQWADLYQKGYTYTLKEGLSFAQNNRVREIVVLLLDEEAKDPLTSSLVEGISALLSVMTNEEPHLLGYLRVYHGTLIDSEAYLERFWKDWDEALSNPKAKRWLKFTERKGLFGAPKVFH